MDVRALLLEAPHPDEESDADNAVGPSAPAAQGIVSSPETTTPAESERATQ
jgi:hypothetical protein